MSLPRLNVTTSPPTLCLGMVNARVFAFWKIEFVAATLKSRMFHCTDDKVIESNVASKGDKTIILDFPDYRTTVSSRQFQYDIRSLYGTLMETVHAPWRPSWDSLQTKMVSLLTMIWSPSLRWEAIRPWYWKSGRTLSPELPTIQTTKTECQAYQAILPPTLPNWRVWPWAYIDIYRNKEDATPSPCNTSRSTGLLSWATTSMILKEHATNS